MTSPEETVRQFGPTLFAGGIRELVDRYVFPLAIEFEGRNYVLETPDIVAMVLKAFRDDMKSRGAVSATTFVDRDAIINGDVAFADGRTVFLDPHGAQVAESRISYVLKLDDGAWRVLIFSADSTGRSTARQFLNQGGAIRSDLTNTVENEAPAQGAANSPKALAERRAGARG